MNRSTPGLPVHHQLPEFTQTHVPSHPLSSPSPLAPNPSQHQSLFQWVNSSHEVAKMTSVMLTATHRVWYRWDRTSLGRWVRHLVFVKWSKTDALFSPRHSKDKTSGKSWALLKYRNKVPTPQVKEDFTVCTCAGRLLGGQRGRAKKEGAPDYNKCGSAPTSLHGGILLSKNLPTYLGKGPRTSQVWKKKQK